MCDSGFPWMSNAGAARLFHPSCRFPVAYDPTGARNDVFDMARSSAVQVRGSVKGRTRFQKDHLADDCGWPRR